MANLVTRRPLKNVTKDRSRHFKFYASVGADISMALVGSQFDGSTGSNMPCAEIHVLGAGNLAVRKVDGTTETIQGIPAGWVLPIEVTHILTAGTTATNILVLF